MNLNSIKTAYFLGIGGIGMSAIARFFNHLGIRVKGYDRTETPLTRQLEEEGMELHYSDRPDLLFDLEGKQEETLVVLTPAIPKDHQEWEWFRNRNFSIQKRSQVLGLLSKDTKTVGVAGTHGKTTTSTLLAHLLQSSHVKCNAFLGGISTNYQSNLLLHPAADSIPSGEQITVVEADEFDRSFLTLFPFYAIITSTDADHLDIYGEHAALQEGFLAYSERLSEGGKLFVKSGLDMIQNLKVSFATYGLTLDADFHASHIRINEAEHIFDLHFGDEKITDLSLGIPGIHNIENAVAASAVAITLGVTESELRSGLISFRGVKRRFEYLLKTPERIFIDDYAHHPEELKAILGSVRKMYPHRKLTCAFQPHLFSRTRDFATGFSEALSLADQVFLLPIYPAREFPIPNVNAEMLLPGIRSVQKELVSKEELVNRVAGIQPELFLTLGAGDIDALVEPIKKVLTA